LTPPPSRQLRQRLRDKIHLKLPPGFNLHRPFELHDKAVTGKVTPARFQQVLRELGIGASLSFR
jgi:hypothetical protein